MGEIKVADDVLKIFADGRVDAKSLSNYMSEPKGRFVSRRLAPPVESFDTHIDKLTRAENAAALIVKTIPDTVNDAINNTAVEGGILADTFVTVTANGAGKIARTQRDKNKDTVSVKDFGAIGDGVTDDTAALQLALNSGASLHWGNNNDVYLIKSTLGQTASNSVHWASNGATIKLDSLTQQLAMIDINANGHDINIDSRLNIDANKKALIGFRATNSSATASDVLINNIFVTRCYRHSVVLGGGGDGILIKGNFNSIVLNDPKVKDIGMAMGAGVSGFEGVTGITIERNFNASQKARQVRIVNPHIEEVYSDDLTYNMDQDGIRVFTTSENNTVLPSDTDVVIQNPYFKNCLGRSIKSQVEFTKVISPHFVRDRGWVGGVGAFEVDFQRGGGSISDVTVLYDGFRPDAIVNSNGSRSSVTKNTMSLATIHGIKGSISNLQSNFYAILSASATDLTKGALNISDIDIQVDDSSAISYVLAFKGANSSNIKINMSKVAMRLNSGVIYDSSSNTGKVNLTDVTSTRLQPCYAINAASSSGLKLSTSNCDNLITASRINPEDLPVAGLEIESIKPAVNSGYSGLIKPFNMLIQAGATGTTGNIGYKTGTFMAMVSANIDAESHALVCCSGTALKVLTPSTIFKFQSGAPLHIYVSAGQLKIINNTQSTVVITGLAVG